MAVTFATYQSDDIEQVFVWLTLDSEEAAIPESFPCQLDGYDARERTIVLHAKGGVMAYLRNLKLLRTLISKEKFDVSFFHSFPLSVFAIALPPLLKDEFKIVTVRHHNRNHIIKKRWKALLTDVLVGFVSKQQIAVSHAVKETVSRETFGFSEPFVITNGVLVNNKVKHNYRSREEVREEMKLLSIGRLDWQKNHELHLNVLANLRSRDITCTLKIVGDGSREYRKNLEKLARELGVSSFVEFTGFIAETSALMAESDVLLHLALDEACPLVILEALDHGIPIVVSDIEPIREILENKCKLFTINDDTEIVTAMEEFRKSPEDWYELAKRLALFFPAKTLAKQMSDNYTNFALSLFRKVKA